MDIQEFNNTKWSRNVILVDGDYVDSVAFNLIVNFERMLGRRIPKADTAWLSTAECARSATPTARHR